MFFCVVSTPTFRVGVSCVQCSCGLAVSFASAPILGAGIGFGLSSAPTVGAGAGCELTVLFPSAPIFGAGVGFCLASAPKIGAGLCCWAFTSAPMFGAGFVVWHVPRRFNAWLRVTGGLLSAVPAAVFASGASDPPPVGAEIALLGLS